MEPFEKTAHISIKPSCSAVHHSDAVDAEMDGEVVAMNAAKGVCFGLNPVGSRVWQLTAAPIKVAEICAILQREYDVDATTCEQQVVAMLEAMVREDLVEITPDP
ncbi:MAG: PqqD family peptide modification chaperone [Candidatus Sphingomonas phytovorans]|nr:PqqD family peptide modification chaperone [Sphingomonas sp.]WEJ99412.1 MAG: PqqD family peptide modification chaperone [Sphingomonas sp.]